MKTINRLSFCTVTSLLALCVPAFGVTVTTLSPSAASPQPVGKTITWTATATDSGAGPLTFQFNVTPPGGAAIMVKDFNVGTLSGSTWTSRPFVWPLTGIEGTYKIQVVAKDFGTGQAAQKAVNFVVNSAVTGGAPVVQRTINPLVALFSAPSCPAGSLMRAAFQKQSGGAVMTTNFVGCHPPASMTFEVAGMLPGTAYNIYAETSTSGHITNGPMVLFTAGALPKTISFPKFTAAPAGTDTTFPVIFHSMVTFTGGTLYPSVATDLAGRIIWYYNPNFNGYNDIITRPLAGGGILSIENDTAWQNVTQQAQFLRQIDLEGNVVRETNMGIIQHQLLAMGAVDGGPCTAIPTPAPVGSACIGGFHHEATQSLPNGQLAVLIDIEKIFPPGTQGDTTGLPVDIMGDMIVILNSNWQVVWYWDVFDPAGGGNGYPKLPITRTALQGETCNATQAGCPPVFLLSPGNIAPLAHDWLHANSVYYWPHNGGASGPGDIIWSARHQDFVFKIDYKDGAGTKDILWRMGPMLAGVSGDFSFNNTYSDPWPWFSHQHDFGIEGQGTGVSTVFDNGNMRVGPTSAGGLGSGCHPNDCNSRGMAFTFNESAMTVTPVVSFDLGGYSSAMGSAQLLANGNYFFENPVVFVLAQNNTFGYSMEVGPTPAAPQIGPANVLMNVSGPQHYRGWQLQNLYTVPTT